MTDQGYIYKTVEITGSSQAGVSDAIRTAIARASTTLRNVEWFEVVSVRGHVANDEIGHFQVTLKVGFRLEE